jgi:hypothetical protein
MVMMLKRKDFDLDIYKNTAKAVFLAYRKHKNLNKQRVLKSSVKCQYFCNFIGGGSEPKEISLI